MKANRVFHIVAAMGLLAVNAWAADPQLTIYNQNFAVVRVLIPLDLKPGENRIQFTDTTAYLEPDIGDSPRPHGSADLADSRAELPGRPRLAAAPSLAVRRKDPRLSVATERPQVGGAGQDHSQRIRLAPDGLLGRRCRSRSSRWTASCALGLPGIPLFPALIGDTILKPTLNWVLTIR